MMCHRYRASLAFIFTVLAGCSTPNSYHTLVPPQTSHAGGERIQVERVTVPPQVDRPQLVVRQGDSGLVILETEWWGASLVDEFGSALQDLLGGPVGGAPKSLLRIEVQRFDSVPGQFALLDAVWRLKRPGLEELTCRTTQQTQAQNSIASLVTAQQTNLRKLAKDISSSAAARSASCPAS